MKALIPYAFTSAVLLFMSLLQAPAATAHSVSRKINFSTSDLEKDSLALVAIYNATGGVSWTTNTNWLTGPVDTWFGVTVADGRVTELDLTSNNLVGAMPPEIGDLENIKVIELRFNRLQGELPEELSNLPNLQKLYLRDNQLEGEIPASLAKLTTLEELHLGTNRFTGQIPTALADLVNLKRLLLGNNQLEGEIPGVLGSMPNLEQFYLNDNQLTGEIPLELSNLSSLQFLTLENNRLEGEIPVELTTLPNLKTLFLNDNQLTGEIPTELRNLTKLLTIRIENNAFTGLPDLSNLTDLTTFVVQNNRFTFEDLEPNIGFLGFVYAPQALVGTARTETVEAGAALSLSIPVGGANNQYQWFKDGNAVPGATADTYEIASATAADAGVYTLQATNTVVTGLTLESHPITVEVTGLAADLQVTKVVDHASAEIGTDVVYTIVLVNHGPNDATGVVVTDPLPDGLTFVSATPGVGNYDNATGAWDAFDLASGANAMLEITATVRLVGIVTNTATVTDADLPDPNGGNDSDSADVTGLEVGVDKEADETGFEQPDRFVALPGFPNPFSTQTTLQYELSRPVEVNISVYDVLGKLVRTMQPPSRLIEGRHEVKWDGTDASGHALPAGTYLVRIQAGKKHLTQSLIKAY